MYLVPTLEDAATDAAAYLDVPPALLHPASTDLKSGLAGAAVTAGEGQMTDMFVDASRSRRTWPVHSRWPTGRPCKVSRLGIEPRTLGLKGRCSTS